MEANRATVMSYRHRPLTRRIVAASSFMRLPGRRADGTSAVSRCGRRAASSSLARPRRCRAENHSPAWSSRTPSRSVDPRTRRRSRADRTAVRISRPGVEGSAVCAAGRADREPPDPHRLAPPLRLVDSAPVGGQHPLGAGDGCAACLPGTAAVCARRPRERVGPGPRAQPASTMASATGVEAPGRALVGGVAGLPATPAPASQHAGIPAP